MGHFACPRSASVIGGAAAPDKAIAKISIRLTFFPFHAGGVDSC
jgi:hypothetical protein